MMGVRVRGNLILLALLLVDCFCLEIPKTAPKNEEKPSGCGENQCSADVSKFKLTSSPPASDPVTSPKPTNPGYADIFNDKGESSRPPLPAFKRQPTPEEMETVHKRLEQRLHEEEHPDEPEKHVLERWGFFDTPTFGELDSQRDEEYSKGIGAFQEMIKDDKKLTKREKDDINDELTKFLEDDHNFQVWSAYVYKQEKHKRKKRGIPDHEIYSYEEMPNPYYQKK